MTRRGLALLCVGLSACSQGPVYPQNMTVGLGLDDTNSLTAQVVCFAPTGDTPTPADCPAICVQINWTALDGDSITTCLQALQGHGFSLQCSSFDAGFLQLAFAPPQSPHVLAIAQVLWADAGPAGGATDVADAGCSGSCFAEAASCACLDDDGGTLPPTSCLWIGQG